MNDKIRAREVRAIDADGTQLGVMNTDDALKRASEKGLDLVEVSPSAEPPVCRMMDYGRYKYQQEKKQAESRRHQATVSIKEIKMRPNTGQHDLDFKMRHIRRFLEAGDRVKVTIRFRGRQIVHPDLGYDLLVDVAEAASDLAVVEAQPRMEGRQMHLLLSPIKK